MLIAVFITFVDLFSTVFYVLLILYVLMSYVASPTNRFYGWLMSLTEPVLAPLRRILPTVPGVDFAPLVAFILLQLLQLALHELVGA